MKTNIVRIGNSRGLRLPKAVLRQCHLGDTVELEVEDNCVIIRPVRRVRGGWDQAFAEMMTRGDDALIDVCTPHVTWDDREWRW